MGANSDGLPRLPRMSGPSKSDRDTLGKRLKSRQLRAEILGWIVGLGLLVEYWDELVDCIVNWHWPSRPLAGGLLVTAGVFGEVLFSRLALITSDELQQRADSDVALANERAAQALDRASRAEQATAEANLARIKLEARLADRHVNSKQISLIAWRLREFTGRLITIQALNDNEVIRFRDGLATAFEMAGLIVFKPAPFAAGGIDPGLALFLGKDTEPFADAIESALIAAEVVSEPIGRVWMNQEGQLMLRVGPK